MEGNLRLQLNNDVLNTSHLVLHEADTFSNLSKIIATTISRQVDALAKLIVLVTTASSHTLRRAITKANEEGW